MNFKIFLVLGIICFTVVLEHANGAKSSDTGFIEIIKKRKLEESRRFFKSKNANRKENEIKDTGEQEDYKQNDNENEDISNDEDPNENENQDQSEDSSADQNEKSPNVDGQIFIKIGNTNVNICEARFIRIAEMTHIKLKDVLVAACSGHSGGIWIVSKIAKYIFNKHFGN